MSSVSVQRRTTLTLVVLSGTMFSCTVQSWAALAESNLGTDRVSHSTNNSTVFSKSTNFVVSMANDFSECVMQNDFDYFLNSVGIRETTQKPYVDVLRTKNAHFVSTIYLSTRADNRGNGQVPGTFIKCAKL